MARLEPVSLQFHATRSFTGIYACRSQGHFFVSWVARQGVTCTFAQLDRHMDKCK